VAGGYCSGQAKLVRQRDAPETESYFFRNLYGIGRGSMKFTREIIALTAVPLFTLACSSHVKSEPEQSATEYLERNYVLDISNFTTSIEQDQSYFYVHFCLKEKIDPIDGLNSRQSVDSCSGADVVVLVEKPSKGAIGAVLRDIALKRRGLPQT
jgi:hypothetical protein